MERSADVMSAGLLEVADPSLSSRFFLKQVCNMFCTKYTRASRQFHDNDTCFLIGSYVLFFLSRTALDGGAR
jgi:hypothetical protein